MVSILLGKCPAKDWRPVLGMLEPPVCQTSQKSDIDSDLMGLIAKKRQTKSSCIHEIQNDEMIDVCTGKVVLGKKVS